jgi:hypothetical protein
MPTRFYKFKLLFDENMPGSSFFPRLNRLFDVKHLRDDLNHAGLTDPQVYDLARKLGRLVVTYNIKDFRTLATQSQETGIIGVSPHLPLYQVDAKLTALLMRSQEKTLLGKYTSISEAA